MSDKSMKLEQAMFILRHGSAEGEHKYFEAISVIEKAYNRLKAENKNCGVKIQNQREQLKACNEKIKEQQAEIERLKQERDEEHDSCNHYMRMCAKAHVEGAKEFAERLKEKAKMPLGTLYGEMLYIEDIDNILKEMG